MSIIERIARKICCAAGDHRYSAVTMDFKFIDDDGDSWCYEISNKCVYCGKPFWSLVNIPKPQYPSEPEIAEVSVLIQHVGYDEAQCGREK